jgi:hypothetical protein
MRHPADLAPLDGSDSSVAWQLMQRAIGQMQRAIGHLADSAAVRRPLHYLAVSLGGDSLSVIAATLLQVKVIGYTRPNQSCNKDVAPAT